VDLHFVAITYTAALLCQTIDTRLVESCYLWNISYNILEDLLRCGFLAQEQCQVIYVNCNSICKGSC